MRDQARRAVAYVAGHLIAGRDSSSIYDVGVRAYFNFSGTVEEDNVSVYDHAEATHITGALPNLFHHGHRSHLTLDVDGQNFSGYDFLSGAHFSGHVSASSLALYDY